MRADIERCDDGYYMPAGHCGQSARYARRAGDELSQLLSLMPEHRRGLVVQAGGHVGHFPAELARHFARVATFEPHPANFRALSANCDRPNVLPICGALGARTTADGPGIVEHWKNSGGHHVSRSQPAGLTFALDSIELDSLDAIVLDAEGAELAIIDGARQTIDRRRPWLQIEQRGHIEGKTGDGTTAELEYKLTALGYERAATVRHDVIWRPL